MDLVLWDMTGDFGRWAETIGDRGRLSNSSSRSGVRERPSESLKLFSLGMVVQMVGRGVSEVWGERKQNPSCSVCPFTTESKLPGVHQKR